MGFGLGSGQRPMPARRMMLRSGPQPSTNIQNPILNRRFLRYRAMAVMNR